MAIYYLDGTSLSNSTAVFTDSELTICATDGMYSNGAIVRELLNCALLPQQTCPSCSVPCDGTINTSGGQGVYLLDLELGGSNFNTGAIVIKFNPQAIPDGILATYDGSKYNKVSSPTYGYLAGSSATNPTYLGSTGSQGTCDGSSVEGTYTGITEYNYVDGSGFVATGLTQDVTVGATYTALTALSPGNCVMVIPKTTASPSTMNIAFYGVCTNTAFNIEVNCPATLTSISSTSTQANSTDACTEAKSSSVYSVPVTGGVGVPALHDWVFSDIYGQNIVAQGFYGLNSNKWIEVSANGVVVATGTCPSTYDLYISSAQLSCSTFCDGVTRLITTPVQSSDAYANVTYGTVIAGSFFGAGFYAYAATSTDTSTEDWLIMELDASNVVQDLLQCANGACEPL